MAQESHSKLSHVVRDDSVAPQQSSPSTSTADVEDLGTVLGPGGEKVRIPKVLPLLPIRGTVVFPSTVLPLAVGRPSSLKMLEETLPQSKIIALFAQRDEDVEDPQPEQLFEVGVAALVLKLIRQPDNSASIIVHGLTRLHLREVVQTKPYLRIVAERMQESPGSGKLFNATVNQLRQQARELIEMTPNAPEQALTVLVNIEDPSNLADFLGANLNLDVPQKQDLLEELDVTKRTYRVLHHVSYQLEILKLQQKIQADVQTSITDVQRKIFLREQMKAIQKELGENEDAGSKAVAQLKEKLAQAKLPEKVESEAQRELGRLDSIHPASPEYSLILTYLQLLADLPWNKASTDNLDLRRARWTLNRDHFGLEKVKRRLIEYLAVRKLNPTGHSPILCFVGPPGVGKTSLGQSIADALGRQFCRLSLGGVRDEAEIRGHRRTYIGAMPGRIVQELRRAGTRNPVMMLDELDKLGADFRGDPASAMLEVLDPKQNHAFVDHYLDVPFDLSQVMFIATANYLGHVPPALQDRMEVIELPGYSEYDKLQIARKYLAPRQLSEHGLKKTQTQWATAGLRKVIEDYTREAGVRELERQIGAVCRGIAYEVALEPLRQHKEKISNDKGRLSNTTPSLMNIRRVRKRVITPFLVRSILGPERYDRELYTKLSQPGVVVGLAYTPVGGEILFIEVASYAGKGNILLTGQIGDVMKESANAALSLCKSRSGKYGWNAELFSKHDLHIHVPAGAVPKDGPSAGVAMFTALVSLLSGKRVKPGIAMTGEITLRGLVLPIGGVKEKTLAAARVGITTVILPKRNERDLEEVDPRVKKKLKFIFVERVDELLVHALGSIGKKVSAAS